MYFSLILLHTVTVLLTKVHIFIINVYTYSKTITTSLIHIHTVRTLVIKVHDFFVNTYTYSKDIIH